MTSSQTELEAFIRYGLGQLSTQNGHHKFEQIAFYLARETISRSVLPATGPVAAKGDHGRDFESYTSRTAGQIGALGAKLGIVSDDDLVFACTLQKQGLRGKILADVDAIVEREPRPSVVVYYCEPDVPVGIRHDLQDVAAKRDSIRLELFDGSAIAGQLAQRRAFWIAQEFLSVPAHLEPGADEERPDWYEEDLARWRESLVHLDRPGDLYDIVGCLRHSWRNPAATEDLQFWLDLTGEYLESSDVGLQQVARYELAVAHLRGVGDLRPADELVRSHLEEVLHQPTSSGLTAATTLHSHLATAALIGCTSASWDEIRHLHDELIRATNELLGGAPSPGQRCELLETSALLRLSPSGASTEGAARNDLDSRPGSGPPIPPEADLQSLVEGGLQVSAEVQLHDPDGGLDAACELADLLPEARLFPVDRLRHTFQLLAPALDHDPRFQCVVEALDDRGGEVYGGDATAEAALQRSGSLHSRGRRLDALRELHRARMGWFSGESQRQMIQVCLAAAVIYRELGLCAAAKHVALVAAYLVPEQDRDLLAPALFEAAFADYHQGAWSGAVTLLSLAMRVHMSQAEDPMNFDRHESIPAAMFETSNIRAGARLAGPEYVERCESLLGGCGLWALADDFEAHLDEPPWWESTTPDEFAAVAAEQLGARPFEDCGPTRTIAWRALGVHWRVEVGNTHGELIVGERLAAALQICCAQLAKSDPVLLPTTVTFVVRTGDERERSVQDTGHGTRVRVSLSRARDRSQVESQRVGQETVAAVFAGIAHISVLPREDFERLMEDVFSGGLLEHLQFGNTYDTALTTIINERMFRMADPTQLAPIGSTNLAEPDNQDPELAVSGTASHYDKEQFSQLIRNRYEAIVDTIPTTLAALRDDEAFKATLEQLRGEGWKDWHILVAVLNITQNHRLPNMTGPEFVSRRDELDSLIWEPEGPEDDPVSVHKFTPQTLPEALRMSWVAAFQVMGLRLQQNPPDIDAVGQLLRDRYRYWDDDVPHGDNLLG